MRNKMVPYLTDAQHSFSSSLAEHISLRTVCVLQYSLCVILSIHSTLVPSLITKCGQRESESLLDALLGTYSKIA